jgi:hypothetical protein
MHAGTMRTYVDGVLADTKPIEASTTSYTFDGRPWFDVVGSHDVWIKIFDPLSGVWVSFRRFSFLSPSSASGTGSTDGLSSVYNKDCHFSHYPRVITCRGFFDYRDGQLAIYLYATSAQSSILSSTGGATTRT